MNLSIAHPSGTHVQRIRNSFQPLAFKAGMIVDAFYEQLAQSGVTAGSVSEQPTWQQKRDLTNTLGMLVNHASDLSQLEAHLLAMGQRHFPAGLSQDRFATLRTTLVNVLAEYCAGSWNDTLKADWSALLDNAYGLMFSPAAKSAPVRIAA